MKYFLLSFASILFLSSARCQVKEQLHVDDKAHCNNIVIKGTVKTGNCYIRPTYHSDLLRVYSNEGMQVRKKILQNKEIQGTYFASLMLEQSGDNGLGQTISKRMLGIQTDQLDDFWTIYLTENKPYTLDLNYGLGNASIDLSNLAVRQLKVHTSSANVNVFYGSPVANKIKMDTFLVRVDVGSLSARQLSFCRTKNIIAEVGFGSILLDFGETLSPGTHVTTSIGTGVLVVILPEYETPIKIKVNDSWLCSLDLHSSLKRISNNTYVNKAYLEKSKNPLFFEIDVPMGEVIFR